MSSIGYRDPCRILLFLRAAQTLWAVLFSRRFASAELCTVPIIIVTSSVTVSAINTIHRAGHAMPADWASNFLGAIKANQNHFSLTNLFDGHRFTMSYDG